MSLPPVALRFRASDVDQRQPGGLRTDRRRTPGHQQNLPGVNLRLPWRTVVIVIPPLRTRFGEKKNCKTSGAGRDHCSAWGKLGQQRQTLGGHARWKDPTCRITLPDTSSLVSRRSFLCYASGTAALIAAGMMPVPAFARADSIKLTILHTNGVHSRIDPFPDNDPGYPGWAVSRRRSALLRQIRSEESDVLLLDAGDIFQGTPISTYIKERPTAAHEEDGTMPSIGNHDFDGGIDNLRERIRTGCQVSVPDAITNSVTRRCTDRYFLQNFQRGGLKIGVLGIGIELQGDWLTRGCMGTHAIWIQCRCQANSPAIKTR